MIAFAVSILLAQKFFKGPIVVPIAIRIRIRLSPSLLLFIISDFLMPLAFVLCFFFLQVLQTSAFDECVKQSLR